MLPAPRRSVPSIVPPEITSPNSWLSASVSVPPDRSTVPPVIATALAFCVAIVPRPRLVRAVPLPVTSDASTPRPPFANGSAPEIAEPLVMSSAPYVTPPLPFDCSTSPVTAVPLIVSASLLSILTNVSSTFISILLPTFDRPSPAVN